MIFNCIYLLLATKVALNGILSYHMSNLRVGETRLAGIADEVGIAWMNQSLRVLVGAWEIFEK